MDVGVLTNIKIKRIIKQYQIARNEKNRDCQKNAKTQWINTKLRNKKERHIHRESLEPQELQHEPLSNELQNYKPDSKNSPSETSMATQQTQTYLDEITTTLEARYNIEQAQGCGHEP